MLLFMLPPRLVRAARETPRIAYVAECHNSIRGVGSTLTHYPRCASLGTRSRNAYTARRHAGRSSASPRLQELAARRGRAADHVRGRELGNGRCAYASIREISPPPSRSAVTQSEPQGAAPRAAGRRAPRARRCASQARVLSGRTERRPIHGGPRFCVPAWRLGGAPGSTLPETHAGWPL